MKDERIETGEFIIIHYKDTLIKVESKSYSWRNKIKNNSQNIYKRFFKLLNFINIRDEDFDKIFPNFYRWDDKSIVEYIKENSIIYWPIEEKEFENNKLYRIWISLIISVPLNLQYKTSLVYRRLLKDRRNLISWIQNLKDNIDLNDEISINIKNVINLARSNAREETIYSNNKFIMERNIEKNIKYLIINEEGNNLYKMIMEMKYNS